MTTLVDEFLPPPFPLLNLDALIEARSPPDASELVVWLWAKLEELANIDELTNTEDERLLLFFSSASLLGLEREEPKFEKNRFQIKELNSENIDNLRNPHL